MVQIEGTTQDYPLEVQIVHESDSGQKLILAVLLEENSSVTNKGSSFLDSIGLPKVNKITETGTTFFAIEEAKIDLAELVGNVCSYFTYQGCATEKKSESCSQEDMAIYVVLT